MDPKFQTSFIPKKPIVVSSMSAPSSSSSSSTNILSILATLLFVVALIASGGLFAYKQVLAKEISQADKDLSAARSTFDPDTIHNLINISSRITSTKQLLDAHVATSQLFSLLQSLTVKRVRFSNFSYAKKDNSLIITMDGESETYNALATQANAFSQNEFIKSPVFSGFDLSTNGTVTFKFTGIIDPNLVSYKRAVLNLPPAGQTAGQERAPSNILSTTTPQ